MRERPQAKPMREAVLPLRFELFLTQTVLGLPQTVHRIGMRIVKQPLADHEVPDHPYEPIRVHP